MKNYIRFIQAALFLALTLVLVNCNNGGGGGNDAPQATSSIPLSLNAANEYLKLGQVALGSLDPSLLAESGLTVSQAAGPAVQFKVGPGNVLYYLSPVEQYSESSSTLNIANGSGSKKWTLTLHWSSRIDSSLTRIVEADENGNTDPNDNIILAVGGVGPDGGVSAAGTTSLSFQLQNAPALDSSLTRVSLNTSSASQDVTSYFIFDGATNTLTLDTAHIAQLLAIIQSAKKAVLTFSFSTPDSAQTFGYEEVLTYADGTLNVSVVNADETHAADFVGVQFTARGFNTGVTALGKLDSSGTLAFQGLPADTYTVTQVLLGSGVPLSGFGTLPTSSSVVALTIYKPAVGSLLPVLNKVAARAVVVSGAKTKTTSERSISQNAPFITIKSVSTGSYTTAATAAAADTLISTPISYTAPMGTTQLGIHIEVTTAEFPVYTGAQSQYNDVWMYNVQFPAPFVALTNSGKVNQSNAAAGTISFDQCLDIAAADPNSGFVVSGMLGAQNVADSALPTSVTITISPSCQGSLSITQFIGQTTTPDGLFAIYPHKATNETTPDGNIAGQYLSVPILAKLPANFGIPASINYSPADATISEVELYLRTASGDTSLGKDYLTQGNSATQGTIKFSGLLLNPTVITPVSERIQIVAVVRGTIQGSAVASQPVALTAGEYMNFTPLYLTSELGAYNSANRFSTRDTGGDSWSTSSMAGYLFGAGLRYNDIAAANVKQLAGPSYRSVLGHSGHSDGQQVDLRYWDGSGGFTDLLGGANGGQGIQDLASTALAEVTANAPLKPNLAALVSWITENRANLTDYASSTSTRRIYIGNGHIHKLLVAGEFPGTTTAIPGVTSWASTMNAKILVQSNHLDHWHLSTSHP